MKDSVLLAKAQREVETARIQSVHDEKMARLARQTMVAAKSKLKQARKLSKLAKKSLRKAEDKAELSVNSLERNQATLEKLEKRIRKRRKKTG